MQTVKKGEKRYIAMKVTRRREGDFTIASASYDVNGIQSGECEIDQGSKEIYFLIDTTLSGFIKGNSYLAEFTVTIDTLPKIIIDHVVISIQ